MTIKINFEIHSIRKIDSLAREAFARGLPASANPYENGSTAHRVWAVSYERLAKAVAA